VANNNLTPREMQVVQCICKGMCTKEIVAHLNISIKTVQTHRCNIMRKLGVDSAVKVVLWAVGNPKVSIEHLSRRPIDAKGESNNESPAHCYL